MNDNDIVKLTPVRLDVLRVEFAKRKLCDCLEPKYQIDYQNRLVWCTECSAVIDPFEALLTIAKSHERINRQHEAMLNERESVAGYEPRFNVIKKLSEKYIGKNSPLVPRCPHCSEPFEIHDLLTTSWCSRVFLREKEEEDGNIL